MRENCYNSRCKENKDNYCLQEDSSVVDRFGRSWIACENHINKPEAVPIIKAQNHQVKNPILELEIE